MYTQLKPLIAASLEEIRSSGLYKEQRVIESRQGAEIQVSGKTYLNFCANNYLGLAGSDTVSIFAKESLDVWGYGLSSVRFICGTQQIHRTLEQAMATYLRKEAVLTFGSCWDANEGLFSALLGDQDTILTDELNHASLIDGIRLCKAERMIFKHMDMADLEAKLQGAFGKRVRCIVTDGVFSMDGHIAPLQEICALAEKYDALVVVDDSHATGFFGPTGRGTPEWCGVEDKVDIITTTFGKALGGASGGCIAGPREVIELLSQKARTSLFTNSLPPFIAATTLRVLSHIEAHPELRERLWSNTHYFRKHMTAAGFTLSSSIHPITPIMLGDGARAQALARKLFDEGIYVIAFSYPVVPINAARIRVQISADHTEAHIDRLVESFRKHYVPEE